MTVQVTKNKNHLSDYLRLLCKLHDVMMAGNGDTVEADAIREQMDEPWYNMTEEEIELAGALSEDLYALEEGAPKQIVMSEEERKRYHAEAGRVFRSADGLLEGNDPLAKQNAASILRFLRKPIPAGLPQANIRFLQARIWERFGELEIALRFMRKAEELDSENMLMVMMLLQQIGRLDDAAEYAVRIIGNPKSKPEELYLASSCLFEKAVVANTESEMKATVRQMATVFARIVRSVKKQPGAREFVSRTGELLGMGYERLGELDKAHAVYNEALEIDLNQSLLLAHRGIILFEKGDEANALSDFKTARSLGSVSVWPTYFLALNALQKRDYNEGWRLCVEGLQMKMPDRARAQLYEWRGICKSMLGQPIEHALEDFDEAQKWDPENEEINLNRQIALKRDKLTRTTSDWRFRCRVTRQPNPPAGNDYYEGGKKALTSQNIDSLSGKTLVTS